MKDKERNLWLSISFSGIGIWGSKRLIKAEHSSHLNLHLFLFYHYHVSVFQSPHSFNYPAVLLESFIIHKFLYIHSNQNQTHTEPPLHWCPIVFPIQFSSRIPTSQSQKASTWVPWKESLSGWSTTGLHLCQQPYSGGAPLSPRTPVWRHSTMLASLSTHSPMVGIKLCMTSSAFTIQMENSVTSCHPFFVGFPCTNNGQGSACIWLYIPYLVTCC